MVSLILTLSYNIAINLAKFHTNQMDELVHDTYPHSAYP